MLFRDEWKHMSVSIEDDSPVYQRLLDLKAPKIFVRLVRDLLESDSEAEGELLDWLKVNPPKDGKRDSWQQAAEKLFAIASALYERINK